MPQTTPTAGCTSGYRDLGDDLRALAAPSEALAQLAARLRTAASTVEAQAAVHRGLLALDWHGLAATAFVGLVAVRALRLERLAGELSDLADGAARRAAAGDAVRSAAGWAS
ncbi:hypothetical protein [Quadrisphaera setariae]|uniref:Excreted virulence factor EspC, type VII ESX diderm n=1 Tax=Quadrisphaera setariae TaxID=2593304 RepID=A0A5C8ZFH4_9ACTN|nr:hypothetical protein [Quadrisphaera setariae]TXR56009.1 hypothetical protein FMM08_11165 [Quadrisphaera setariae]